MGIHSGVMFAVTCVEDIPFIPDESEWAERGPFDYSSHTRMMCDVCRGWDVPDNLQAVIPTESNVPVLLLSGEADPVTHSGAGGEGAGVSDQQSAYCRAEYGPWHDRSRLR